MMGGGMMYGFGWTGLILNVAIIVGIVILVVWAVKRFTSGSVSPSGQTPREILQLAMHVARSLASSISRC